MEKATHFFTPPLTKERHAVNCIQGTKPAPHTPNHSFILPTTHHSNTLLLSLVLSLREAENKRGLLLLPHLRSIIGMLHAFPPLRPQRTLFFAADILFWGSGLVLILLDLLDYSASITYSSCRLRRISVSPQILQILLLHVFLHPICAAISQLSIYPLAIMAIIYILKFGHITKWYQWCYFLLGAHARCWQQG